MEPKYYDLLVEAAVHADAALDAISKAYELCPAEPYNAAVEIEAMKEFRRLHSAIMKRSREFLNSK
jgi:hypothetical protein